MPISLKSGVVYTFHPSILETEANEAVVLSEFQDSQGYAREIVFQKINKQNPPLKNVILGLKRWLSS